MAEVPATATTNADVLIGSTPSDSFSEYKLCSHCAPGSNRRSHLWARYSRAWSGKGHKNSKDGSGSSQVTPSPFLHKCIVALFLRLKRYLGFALGFGSLQ